MSLSRRFDGGSLFKSDKRILIYIPSYNCGEKVKAILDEMEPTLWDTADVLVIDNRSQDGTVQLLQKCNAAKRWARPVAIIQPEENRGYSGSQKLAYWLMLEHSNYEWILMLHGDGQYDPALVKHFLPHMNDNHEMVYGYRSWTNYWSKDETPWSSYLSIKTLSVLESLVTGYWRKEWHSGMVAYHRSFLRRVNFANVTTTMHIDGHLHFAAGRLGARVKPVPIYKRYRNYEPIGKTARVRYVFDVLRLIPRLKSIPIQIGEVVESQEQSHSIPIDYTKFDFIASFQPQES
jgi:glycosyltransferase involved in cell wall biosynthesis